MNNKKGINNLRKLYILNKKAIIQTSCIFFIMAIGVVIIVNTICRLDYIPSSSMENTLKVGDYIFTNKISYILNNQPERGEIINFIAPDDRKQFVKRVIGLPNDTIWIKQGIVYINDVPLNEDYITPFTEEDCGPFIIPPNKYFVLGDNRGNSYDSRYWKGKYVSRDDILGKVKVSFNTKEVRASLY